MSLLGHQIDWGGFNGTNIKVSNFKAKVIFWHQNKFKVLALHCQVPNIIAISSW